MSDGLEYDEGYHEHLRPGDLRTAEDVYRWMCSPVGKRLADHRMWLLAKGEYAFMDHCEDYVMLRERLDRERRQACRRAALENWRAFRRCLSPMWTFDPVDEIQEELWREGNDLSCCWGFKCLALALHFRAEARRP